MKRIVYVSFFLVIVLASLPVSAAPKTYRLITMELSPYNYTENGRITGICTDIVKEILKRLGHPEKISLLPLIRAYKMLENNDDIILFSRLRTPSREHKNKWAGPLVPFKIVLYARKDRDFTFMTIEDIKKYSVGCSQSSLGHRLLKEYGITEIHPLSSGNLNARKLAFGRIDLWMTSELAGRHSALKYQVNPDQFEVVYVFQPVRSLYIAFSNNIGDDVVGKWQKTLDQLKADGTYAAIVEKYLLPLHMNGKGRLKN